MQSCSFVWACSADSTPSTLSVTITEGVSQRKGISCATQLYVCFCTSPYTGSLHSCQQCYQFLNQLKIKPVLSQGNLLHLPAQVLLVAGGYGRRTWEWVAWDQLYLFLRQSYSFQVLPQLTKDYWHVLLLPISTICMVLPLSLCQLLCSPDTHVNGANFHYRQKQT